MKRMKRIFSIILVLLMIVLAVPVGNLAGVDIFPKAQATYRVGDTIQFGTYPQTKVAETAALKSAATTATWKSYGYYTGTNTPADGQMQSGDWMMFADFFYNGEKYRAVTFSKYRPYYTFCTSTSGVSPLFQKDYGYVLNTIYYFRYDPLKWRILDPSTGYVMCESIVDAQAYQNILYKSGSEYYQGIGSSVYANDYKSSFIHDWLNYDFFETAFSDIQKNKIKTTALNNDAFSTEYTKYNSDATNDKIYLLSWADALNGSYGFSSSSSSDSTRQAQGTDYAKCQGIGDFDEIYQNYKHWILRSAGRGSTFTTGGYYSGGMDKASYIDNLCGIRPGCRLLTLENDTTVSSTLFSKIGNEIPDSNIYNLGEETYGFQNYDDADSWGGHCFGMSSTSSMYYLGLLNTSMIGISSSDKLYTAPSSATVKKPICYYQGIQGSYSRGAIVAGGSSYLHKYYDIELDWTAVINYVKNHNYDNKGSLQIGYRKDSEGGHAINFLRYEVVNGQERIYAYDNNYPNRETYFYKDSNGKVWQTPATFSGAIDCIALRDVKKYYQLAGGFDATRVFYADEGSISIVNAESCAMECGPQSGEHYMYELPGSATQVQIIPQKDDATFTYMEKDYRFEQVDDDTYGVFTLENMTEGSSAGGANFTIYNAPATTDNPNLCPWCGGRHEGFFAGLIAWFHNLFAAIFGARY